MKGHCEECATGNRRQKDPVTGIYWRVFRPYLTNDEWETLATAAEHGRLGHGHEEFNDLMLALRERFASQ